MLSLRSSILAHLLSSPSSSLQRLLYATAPRIPRRPRFAVERYLVQTCGLNQAQALKASRKLSHLKSPSKPDAVLAFLAGLGLSGTDVAALVAKDPLFLCTRVDTTLAPSVSGLTGLGLSTSQVARLVAVAPDRFRSGRIVSKVQYYLPLFGSSDKFLRVIKCALNLLSSDLERVVKPNVEFLRGHSLVDSDFLRLGLSAPWLFSANLERIQAIVACAQGLGVPRGSVMFSYALAAVEYLGEDKVATKVEYLKKTFRWSDAEVRIAVSKFPTMLTRSQDILHSRSDFLISEVGLEPAYVAHRPALLSYSLEGRLRPRYYVVKFLKENRLLDPGRSYYYAVSVTEKEFMDKYIIPHNEAAPHLSEDYAASCRGEVPARFRST